MAATPAEQKMGGQNELPQKVPLCHVDYFQLKTMGAQQTQEGASQVALAVKNPPANAGDIRDAVSKPRLERSPGGGNGNSNILARRIPWTEEPGRLQSMGSHQFGHD